MRISWLSNAPWSSTGYGNQTRLFVPLLEQAGHDMGIIAFYGLEGGVLHMGKTRVYPRAFDPYGQDIAGLHAADFQSDIMISLMDAWVCQPHAWPPATRWVPWFPVDHDPLPRIVRDRVGIAYERIVYSRFGERMVRESGLDCHYVPHGVNTQVFAPGDKSEARRAFGFPQDAFIIGMVAANKGVPCRKAFFEQIEAFAMLKRKHPDALLYLHTLAALNGSNEVANLPEFIEAVGLKPGVDVQFPPAYSLAGSGLDDAVLARLYTCFDVLTSVSMGEGFGIPILEAQACGVPVIVGDWTAMSELCFGGWKVSQKDASRWWTPQASYQWRPEPAAIAKVYEAAYGHRGAKGAQARKGALAYDADRVVREHWTPVLAQIAERIANEEQRTPNVLPMPELAVAG